MIDNITKLYEIAGVESTSFNIYRLEDEYPPFTAEKQLKLIKWLGKLAPFNISFSVDAWYIKVVSKNKNLDYLSVNYNFDNGIADLIIDLWQDLTVNQKQEIKGILQ